MAEVSCLLDFQCMCVLHMREMQGIYREEQPRTLRAHGGNVIHLVMHLVRDDVIQNIPEGSRPSRRFMEHSRTVWKSLDVHDVMHLNTPTRTDYSITPMPCRQASSLCSGTGLVRESAIISSVLQYSNFTSWRATRSLAK